MHTVFALLCFVVVIHWLIFPYPSGLLHWHCGNLTIAPVPAKQPWWIWMNTSCEFIMNDCITTTKQSTKKTCAYFLGYTVTRYRLVLMMISGIYESNSSRWIFKWFSCPMSPESLLNLITHSLQMIQHFVFAVVQGVILFCGTINTFFKQNEACGVWLISYQQNSISWGSWEL